MHLLTTSSALRDYRQTLHQTQQTLGLIPTMGALHEGHLALIQQASQVADQAIIASIFVNPVQFTNADDLARYPRTLDADCRLLEQAGCQAVFAPSVEEMYPEPPALTLNFGELETVMEGAFRPGHFNGVGIVVAKLFNLIQPDQAYFGQKDLQQVAVVRRLINDLSFPVELIRCPTLREADGLAMSSRNRLLTPDERQQAPALFDALTMARKLLEQGKSVEQAKEAVTGYFSQRAGFRFEYIEVAHADTLRPVSALQAPGQTAICLATALGQVRLIDNVVF